MRRSVAVSTLALCLLLGPTFSAHAQAPQAVAQARFNKGRELFIAGNYQGALVEFRAATEVVESPNTRLYIARCERELGHFARASSEYARAEAEAADRSTTDPRYASTREAARQEAATLEGKLAHVVVSGDQLPKDLTIDLGGEPLSAAALGVELPVDPPRIEVTARAKGFKTFHKVVEIGPGEDAKIILRLDAEPRAAESAEPPATRADDRNAPEPRASSTPRYTGGGVRTAGYLVGGAGAIGVGLFATFAIMANNRYVQLRGDCAPHCDARYQTLIDEGKQSQLMANVALGAGAALLATGAIMIAAGGPKLVHDDRARTRTFLPLASTDGHGVSLGVIHGF